MALGRRSVREFLGRHVRAILTYHSIDRAGTAISVTPEGFARHISWLAHSSVRVVPLAELLEAQESADAASITFDDALGSVMEIAAPILAGHGLTATLFVPTGRVGGDNRWHGTGDPGIPVQRVMTWEEIGTLAERGWTIGAHTRTHPRLNECADQRLTDELEGAAEDIRTNTGNRPRTLAYPYGANDSRVRVAAGRVYDMACTVDLRPLGRAEDRTTLPRLDAYFLHGAGAIEGWGSGVQRRYLSLRRTIRRIRRRQ